MDVNVISQGRQSISNYGDSSVEKPQSIQADGTKQSSENEPVSVKDAKKAVDKLNKLLEDNSTHIEYEQDETFKQVMIMRVVDNDTRKVIKEIPSKKILDMVAQFCEMAGLLVDKKA